MFGDRYAMAIATRTDSVPDERTMELTTGARHENQLGIGTGQYERTTFYTLFPRVSEPAVQTDALQE